MKHGVKWDSGSAPDKEKPPRRNPGGQKEPNRWASAFDRVAALRVLGFGGRDRQAHLLPQGAGQEPTDRVRLPAGGFHEFLQGGAAGVLQQVEDLGGLAALAGAVAFFLGDLADFVPLVAFFARLACLPDLALDGAT